MYRGIYREEKKCILENWYTIKENWLNSIIDVHENENCFKALGWVFERNNIKNKLNSYIW